jgi:DNA-binding transcriptional MocR family regulator
MVVTGIIQRHQQPALPQAIKLTNAEGRSCISVPITQDGIDSQGYVFGPDDE